MHSIHTLGRIVLAVGVCSAIAAAEPVSEVIPADQVAQRGAQVARINAEIKQMTIDSFEARTQKDAAGKVLPYRLFKPGQIDAQKRYPLVIFFHGAGERGTDNAKQLNLGGKAGAFLWALPENQKQHPCFVAAPQCPNEDMWANVNWGAASHEVKPETAAMRLALEMIDSLMKEFPIDPDRVYVTGLSMGGYGTWDLLGRRPGMVAAAIPVCGGLGDGQAEKIASIPQWIFHGGKDTVVKTIRSRNAFEQLKAAGAKTLHYTEFEGVGHNSWDAAYATPGLVDWLMSQKRVQSAAGEPRR